MKNICCLIICLMCVSCKQGIFLKRKYTDGFYFSKAGSVHLKEINRLKTKNTAVGFSAQTPVLLPTEPLTDTIILSTGKKLPCKVKAIERKSTTYTDGKPGPAGPNKIIKNKNIARIHFSEGQKEYFRQYHVNGNPILQFDFIRTKNPPRKGLAFFGYTLVALTSFGLIIATIFVGFFFLVFAIASLICLSSYNYESLAYKIIKGFGTFIAILFFIGLGIILAALMILIASF